MIAFSGVRSSWLTAARKRLFANSMPRLVSVEAAKAARKAATSSFVLTMAVISRSAPVDRIISIKNGR